MKSGCQLLVNVRFCKKFPNCVFRKSCKELDKELDNGKVQRINRE